MNTSKTVDVVFEVLPEVVHECLPLPRIEGQSMRTKILRCECGKHYVARETNPRGGGISNDWGWSWVRLRPWHSEARAYRKARRWSWWTNLALPLPYPVPRPAQTSALRDDDFEL